MKHRSALLGTSTGVWATKRPESALSRLMAADGLKVGDVITIPVDELIDAGGDVLACPSVASGAARTRE